MPGIDGDATASVAANAAHRRAMPLARLIGNGMEWADAHELHRRAEASEPWHLIGRDIGDRNRARARQALADGHRRTAAELFLFASAAYRFGQNPLLDGAEKANLYADLVASYRDGGQLLGGVEATAVPFRDHCLYGWLHRPDSSANPPVVIVFGGFDGWREEYHVGARRLVDQGLAVLLIDLPGQGETRIRGGLPMPADPGDLDEAMTTVVTWTQQGRGLGVPAVWGNSMGGYLAARLACRDPRIAATCVNGGTYYPAEILDRYPRFVSKAESLFGRPGDPDTAAALLRRHRLEPEDLAALSSPLLVLHGEPDQVFLVSSARWIAERAASRDAVLRVWADGDHCLYNHPHERNTLISDWFTDRLLPRT